MKPTETTALAPEKPLSAYLDETSFAVPEYLDPESAWIEHAPFASWLVAAIEPTAIAELGTHGGYSYFVFCAAVASSGRPARCFAVDHWLGDDHAGFYGNEVYERVRAHNDTHYAAFSQLIRASFDDASLAMPDGTVDLLHIDGRHAYDDVKHDFETWLPKLSERGVVLLHDTAVRERGFGVFRLMDELRGQYPTFEFAHGFGLGVIAVGSAPPSRVTDLCSIPRESARAEVVRGAYARLGLAISAPLQARVAAEAAARELAAAVETERSAFLTSTSWRITSPLRAVSRRTRSVMRRADH